MRIAHVTDVKIGLSSGIERYVFDLAVAQKARGDLPTVVVSEPGELTAACDEHGIPVVVTHLVEQRATMIDDLCSLFTDLGVEVISCHFPHRSVIVAGNRLGIPCVYTHHIHQEFRIPDAEFTVIAVSKSTFERMKSSGFPEARLYHIPNGAKVVPRVTNGSPPPGLISVARLEHIKGHDIAILAMVELKRRLGVDCPALNLYGAGKWEEYLKEMVSVLRLDDVVRFHGVHLGILERCPATDILIVSSRMEAGPMVAVEAMSRGMPIVAFRVGEIEEMIPDRRYGYVVEKKSIKALADGIDSMLSDVRAGRFDPDLQVSRHRALYTVDKMAEHIDAVYECLTGRNSN